MKCTKVANCIFQSFKTNAKQSPKANQTEWPKPSQKGKLNETFHKLPKSYQKAIQNKYKMLSQRSRKYGKRDKSYAEESS